LRGQCGTDSSDERMSTAGLIGDVESGLPRARTVMGRR
jgi:hypothetical protein